MQILIASLFAVAMVAEPNAQFDKAKELVAAQMRDPESAVFTKMHMGKTPDVVCGTVRGKNGYGGYANAEPFEVSLTSGDTIFIDDTILEGVQWRVPLAVGILRNYSIVCRGP
jgi:hypothetical protein